jgi:DNA-binding IclR family transcriptional regulator
MSDPSADDIARQDEMLELLFWLEGEGFPGRATLPDIARFLTWPEPEAARILGRLVERGDIVRRPADEYRLTEIGRREAGRRFAEEFSPLLAQGHGECNDPQCECRTKGPAECHGGPGDRD